MNQHVFSPFDDFQRQAEKALDLVRNLSAEDKVRAALLWNALSTKLEAMITDDEIKAVQSVKDEVHIPMSPCFQDAAFGIGMSCSEAEELRLDDDRAIDKVLDEVIHLEAEAEEEQLKATMSAAASRSSPESNGALSTSQLAPDPGPVTKVPAEDTADVIPPPKPQKAFKCNQCPSSFSTRGNLNVHLKSHSGERGYCCPKCPKRFITSGNLRRHLKSSHLKLKPYRCSVCHSCFTEKKSLIIHQRLHSGERPYSCPHCTKSFAQSAVLQTHLNSHTSEKNFPCSKCSKSFKQKAHLQRHFDFVHSGVRNCICTECGFAFARNSDLQRHLRSHRGEKSFVCERCGKKFMRQENLNEHINHHDSD